MSNETVAKVLETIRRHELLTPGQRVIVGCSGGADSTCLLHLLASGTAGVQVTCIAVYVDHGLRKETAEERAIVERVARSLGAEFVVVSVDVPSHLEEHGGSVQEVARNLRYKALRDEARSKGAQAIAVGHTRSDQAETLVLQLLRGAGTTGLAGMAHRSGEIVRPLLDVPRSGTEAYCQALSLPWFDDPSNTKEHYLRNRVRRQLMPQLEAFNPRIEEGLARTAEILRAEDRHLEEAARSEYERLAHPLEEAGQSGVWFEVNAVKMLSLALQRRVIRLAVRRVAGERQTPTFDQVEEILKLTQSVEGSAEWRGAATLCVVREYERLFVCGAGSREKEAVHPGEFPLLLPDSGLGEVYVPWAKMKLSLHRFDPAETPESTASARPRHKREAVLSLDALALPLTVRVRRPGDTLHPLGLGGRKKIKDLLIDAKVPKSERERVPIVSDQVGIVWVVGHAIDERVKVRAESRRLVRLEAVLDVVLQ